MQRLCLRLRVTGEKSTPLDPGHVTMRENDSLKLYLLHTLSSMGWM